MNTDFYLLHVPCIEKLISAVAEEARPYLFNTNEPFNFNFTLIVFEKDVSITPNLTNPESAPEYLKLVFLVILEKET